jgi:hypothetical protein
MVRLPDYPTRSKPCSSYESQNITASTLRTVASAIDWVLFNAAPPQTSRTSCREHSGGGDGICAAGVALEKG